MATEHPQAIARFQQNTKRVRTEPRPRLWRYYCCSGKLELGTTVLIEDIRGILRNILRIKKKKWTHNVQGLNLAGWLRTRGLKAEEDAGNCRWHLPQGTHNGKARSEKLCSECVDAGRRLQARGLPHRACIPFYPRRPFHPVFICTTQALE